MSLSSIEEFEKVNERYQFLEGQRKDLEQAIADLQHIIQDLTHNMEQIFAREFVRINEHFGQTFVELFGGGQASLQLEDEKDILNCGIEIRVELPGKSQRAISLLSGGEKALVAIVLYFAILKVRPTPFCVLDEIEAALDDVNVAALCPIPAGPVRQDPVYLDHPPAGHHGGGGYALWRHHAGAGRLQAPSSCAAERGSNQDPCDARMRSAERKG